jgi:NADH-quinone oxidoreductase subunit H
MGGWRGPFARDIVPLGFVYLMIKSLIAYFVIIWVRLTVPRIRIDQLLDFNWKFLVPLSLINLLVIAFLWKIIPDTDNINSFGDAVLPTLVLFAANVIMLAGVLMILREYGRRERERLAAKIAAMEGDGAADAVPAGAGD